MAIKYPENYALGQDKTKAFPKIQFDKIVEMIDAINALSSSTMFAGFYPTTIQNDIAAGTGGAISIANYLTTINTDAGGDAFTLANGTYSGQLKKILLVIDGGGDATITLTGYTSITMNDATDYVVLLWDGSAWKAVENFGCTIV